MLARHCKQHYELMCDTANSLLSQSGSTYHINFHKATQRAKIEHTIWKSIKIELKIFSMVCRIGLCLTCFIGWMVRLVSSISRAHLSFSRPISRPLEPLNPNKAPWNFFRVEVQKQKGPFVSIPFGVEIRWRPHQPLKCFDPLFVYCSKYSHHSLRERDKKSCLTGFYIP